MTEILLYAAIFLIVCFLVAQFLKAKFKAQLIFKIIAIIRSKKPLGFFEKFAKYKRLLNAFADLGLILGFGSIAVDYLYGRKFSNPKRILIFAISFAILYAFIYFLLGLKPAGGLLAENSVLVFSSFALFGLAGFSLVLIGINALDVLQKLIVGEKAIPGVAPLIPGVQIPNVPIFVPLHGWLSLLIILIVHEGMHGIVARMLKIKLKTAGIITFGFLPIGAFVEPDEKKFQKEKPLKRLKVLSAGPMANLALFVISFGVFILLSSILLAPFASNQIVVAGVLETITIDGQKIPAPAFGKLNAGDIILSVNGVKISGIEGLREEIGKSQVLEFKAKDVNGVVSKRTIEKTSAGAIGAFFEQPYSKETPQLNFLVVEFFFWLFILNFLVAVANFIPFWVFDGGQIVKLLFLPYLRFLKMPEKEVEKLVGRVFLWIVGILLLINALPLFQF